MVATKDIVMEPTLKSLNDDLVIMNFLLDTCQHFVEFPRAQKPRNLNFLGWKEFHVTSVTLWWLRPDSFVLRVCGHALLIGTEVFCRTY